MASLAGTSSDDFLIATANGTEYRGGKGNDTYILTPLIPTNAVITIIDTEGANKVQLAEGLTIASSKFFADAAELTLSNGAIVRILGASKFTFDIGANAVAGDTTVTTGTTSGGTYAQFAASLGVATLPAAGATTPATGTANYSTTTGGGAGAATYALAAAATSVNEGTKATFTLTTSNVASGTEVAYTLTGITAADLASGALTGKATVGTDGKATIEVDLKADVTTEGAETLVITLDGKTTTASTTVVDTSMAPVYTLTSDKASVDEGSSVTYSLVTANVASGTALTYELSGTGIADADVKVALKGTLTVGSDGKASLTVPTVADSKTEGNESLTLTLKDAAAAAVATASTTITDTSTTPPYSVSVNKSQVQEGGTFTFTITPAEDVATETTVQWNIQGDTIGGSVTAGSFGDVNPSNGKVTFAAGTKAGAGQAVTVGVVSTDGEEALEGMRFYLLKDDGSNTILDQNQTVTIQDSPSYVFGANASIDEGSDAVFTLTTKNVNDTKVAYTVSGTATGADVSGGALASGDFTLAADGTASVKFTTLKDLLTEGSETITVTAGGKSQTITINDTSLTPVYTVTPGADISEGDTASFTVTADSAVSATLAYTVTGADSKDVSSTTVLKGDVTLVNGTGTVKLDSLKDATTEGSETWTLTLDATSKTGSVKVADISVTPILNIDNATGTTVSGQGTAIIKQSTLLANDLDSTGLAAPTGAVSVVSTTNGQAFASSNGDIIYVADAGKRQGTFEYNVAGIDSGIKGLVNVNINTAPVIGTTTALSTKQDTAATGTVTATDADGDTMTYVFSATNGTVTNTGGSYTYTPKAGYIGSDTITVTATDNFAVPLTSAAATIPVTVTATPTFTISGATAASEAANASFDVTLTSPAAATAYAVTVALAATGGATAGTDFTNALTLDAASTAAGITLVGGVLTFPANATVTKATLTTAVTADASSPETGEGLSVTLSAPTNSAIVGTASAVTTAITDVPLTYTINTVATVAEGVSAAYTVTASAPVLTDTVVAFSVLPGDATAADQGTSNANLNDFSQGSFNPASVTIKAGSSTAQYSVTPSADAITELPENFKVQAVIGTTTLTTTTSLLDGTSATGGQTFTLTTGMDQVGGTGGMKGSSNTTSTDGDDIIKAGIDSGAGSVNNTLTSLDSIDGGKHTTADKLQINAFTDFAWPAGATVTNVEEVTIMAAGKLGTYADNNAANVDLSTTLAGVTKLTLTGGSAVDLKAPSTAAVTLASPTGDVELLGGASQTLTVGTAAGNLELLGSAGALSATITEQGTKTLQINDGTTVTVNNTATIVAADSGTITIGDAGTAKPSGAINVTQTLKSDGSTGSQAGGAIAITGGTTVNVTQSVTSTATVETADGFTSTASAVKVTSGAATTDVTVTQTKTANTFTKAGTAVVKETSVVTFGAVKTGETLAFNGLTFTAAKDLTAAQAAAAFANLTAADTQSATGPTANGIYSGTFNTAVWTSGAVSGNTVTFTATDDDEVDLAFTGTSTTNDAGARIPTQVKTAGTAAVASDSSTSGVAYGAVRVDGNGATETIKNITLNGYASADLGSTGADLNALTTLSLANSAGTADVATSATTLGLTLNNVTHAVNIDKTGTPAATLNVTTTGANSTFALTAAGVKNLTVGGSNVLNLTGSTLTALETVVVKDTAGLNLTGITAKTSVNTTATTGAVSVQIDGTAATYTGGAGADTVTLVTGTALTKAIDLGAGDDTLSFAALAVTGSTALLSGGTGTDTLSMNAARAVALSGAPQTFYTNFERLLINDTAGDNDNSKDTVTVDLANLGFTSYVTTAGTVLDTTTAANSDTLVLSNLASSGTVNVIASAASANQAITVQVKDAATGTADVVNFGTYVSSADVNFGTFTAANVETVKITSTDSEVNTTLGQVVNTATLALVATSATSIEISGNSHVALTNTGNTKVTMIDGSTMTGNLTVTAAGTVASTIKGGSGGDTLTASSALISTVNAAGTAAVIKADGTGTSKTGANAVAEVQTLTVTADATDDGDETFTVTYGTNASGGTGTVSITDAAIDVTNKAAVATAIKNALNLDGAFSGLATASVGTNVGVDDHIVSITYSTAGVNINTTASVAVGGTKVALAVAGADKTQGAAAVAEVTTVALTDGTTNAGLSTGDTMKLTVGGTTYTYTAAGTVTMDTAAAGLATLIAANTKVASATYAAGSDTFTITAATAGTAGNLTVGTYAVADGTDVAATADTLLGGDGADTLIPNTALSVLTGGAGKDTFNIKVASLNVNTPSTITDPQSGDIVKFDGATAFKQAQVTLDPSGNPNLVSYADAAIASIATNEMAWFQYNGNTYIVMEASGSDSTNTFVNGTDFIVKLTGLVDLGTGASYNSTGNLLEFV